MRWGAELVAKCRGRGGTDVGAPVCPVKEADDDEWQSEVEAGRLL
jgi:hypothetical protein